MKKRSKEAVLLIITGFHTSVLVSGLHYRMIRKGTKKLFWAQFIDCMCLMGYRIPESLIKTTWYIAPLLAKDLFIGKALTQKSWHCSVIRTHILCVLFTYLTGTTFFFLLLLSLVVMINNFPYYLNFWGSFICFITCRFNLRNTDK